MVKQKKVKDESMITPVKVNDQKSKPTPDQMRIAQILDKKVVDSTLKQKLKQIMDATQRSADEVYVALHDSDFDVNRAVDLLIEGNSLADWCTSEKKKKKLQELKEKKTDDNLVVPEINEEAPKTARNTSYRGRGDDRRRPGRGRGTNFGERRERSNNEESSSFRGRGFHGRGRRSQRIIPGGTMVFERSNTSEVNNSGNQPPVTVQNRWERPLVHNAEEDWDTEEFTGSLSQTQIFTSSSKLVPKKVDIIDEEPKKVSSGVSECTHSLQTSIPLTASLPPPLMVQSSTPTCRPPEAVFTSVNNSTNVKNSPPQQECLSPPLEKLSNPPPELQPEYIYHLSNFSSKPDVLVSSSDEKRTAPSKIPTSAVEMPPEMKSSLSFLDIQFGSMDLGPSASEESTSEPHSNISSQNASTTTLIPPSSIPSSASMTQLIANNSISSSTSSNNLTQSNAISNPASTNNMITPSSITTVTGISHLVQPNSISSVAGINHLVTSTNIHTAANMNHVVNNTLPTSANVSHMMGSNNMTGSNHLHGPSSLSSGPPSNQSQGRFMTSSQSYTSNHLPYSFIAPPSGSTAHPYESRAHETNTSIPPPHIAQPPHLPPFKQTPPGVPKGAIVANLPPGSLVGNQYIVGQSNVPYFPHHPIYYYEEMAPVMNNQQRLAHHMTSGYDVSYQTTTPSNRDGVHYNV